MAKHSDFFVRRGEIVGFAGLMGAGRTELMRRASSAAPTAPTSRARSSRTARRSSSSPSPTPSTHGLAYVTEDRKTLGLNLLDDIKRSTVAAKLSNASPAASSSTSARSTTTPRTTASACAIKAPTVDEGVAKLSGGNQQKVVLAKWMFTDPDLLILDEPTRGIDVGRQVRDLRHHPALAAEGKGVILISSELPELIGLSDRIYTIVRGRRSPATSPARRRQTRDAPHDEHP